MEKTDKMKTIQIPNTPNRNTPFDFIRANFLLFLICTLGVSLRFYNLGTESLWVDEGHSARIAQLGFTQIMHELFLDAHPPVYFFCLHIWSLLFGNSEFALRSFSVLAGGISILFSYAIGKQLFCKTTGLVTALFIALNTYLIAISQETRMYSLLFCLSLISFYYYIRTINSGKYRVKAAWFISTVLLLYTHIHGSFVLCAQGLAALLLFFVKHNKAPKNLRGVLVLQFLVGITFLPWLFVVKLQLIGRMEAWIPIPSCSTLLETFMEFAGSYYSKTIFFVLLGIALFPRKILMKIPVARKLFNMGTIRNQHDLDLLAISFSLLWLSTIILLPFTISKIMMSIYRTKYVVAALLPFVLLTVSGIMAISNKWIKVSITILIVILSVFNTETYFKTLHKDQWREAVRYIESYAQPGDVMIFNAGFNLENAYNYYSKRNDLIKIPFPAKTTRVNLSVDENNIHELDSVIGKYNHIWIIASQNRDPKGLISQKLDSQYNFIGKQYFKGVGIFIFELRG